LLIYSKITPADIPYIDAHFDEQSICIYLTYNRSVTIELIIALIDKPWFMWDLISKKDGITLDLVLRNRNIPWSWDELSYNYWVTFDDVMAHPELPWNYDSLSCAGIAFDISRADLSKPWNWGSIACNEWVTLYDIFDHPELPWTEFMSHNYSICLKNVRVTPGLPHGMVELYDDRKDRVGEGHATYIIPFADMHNRALYTDVINRPELPWDWAQLSYLCNKGPYYPYLGVEHYLP